jgi:tungstate transport system substrate-binding protein
MPAHKYTILQIGIICFLTAIIGVRLVSQFPEWFNGQGGNSLNFAAASDAYALTDRATWANFKNRQNLEILTEGDPALFNLYGSILVNPAKWPEVKFAEAKIWEQWLTSRVGLDVITSYRIDGEELFFPPRPRL